ncbi:histone acetyltransferase [Arabis alpina]|uniref:histone acetyltransferase n=1 Tax=Arabis alpina TaxID=50452 RepID=A0A087HP23_ARAAL|nr:histone acetyltransferase [Arabis alpina]
MNVQAHMSGQLSGQVPSQGTMPQNNGNSQLQNLVGVTSAGAAARVGSSPNTVGHMDHEINKLRQYMQTLQRQPSPADAASKAKYMDVARRLEEGLFKLANNKEDYLNRTTLESRITSLIKGRQMNNHNQRHANSSSVGTPTMIPTPGLSQAGGNTNLKVASSADTTMVGNNNITSTAVNTGNLLTAGGMHGGSMSNGYQHSSRNFSLGSGGNMASLSTQSSTSQMIPTPGFVNSGTNNNNGGFSAEPTMVPQSQQQQQRQHTGGQNSHMLSNQMTTRLRPDMQPKPSGVADSSVNGGVGVNEKFVDSGLSYTSSSKNLQQTIDHFPQSGMQGEGRITTNPDPFGSGNLQGAVTSIGTLKNAQNTNAASFQSVSRANSSLLHPQQQFQQQPIRFQQQPNQIQQQQKQFLHQQKFKQQTLQAHRLISNDGLVKAQVASDIVTDVKHETGMENHRESVHSQASERFQLSQFQNQYQNSRENGHADAQLLSVTSQSDICSPLPQNSQQVQQMLQPQNIGSDSINSFTNLAVRAKSESNPHGQWHSQSQENTQMSNGMSSEQHVQEDFHQRITGMDEAQPNNMTEGSVIGQSHTSTISESHHLQNPIGTTFRYGNISQEPKFRNQQRWLLFLRHARSCKPPGGKCQDRNCFTVKKLWSHMDSCAEPQCLYPRCRHTKALLSHYKNCKDPRCPVCVPVKTYFQNQADARALARLKSENTAVSSVNIAVVSNDFVHVSAGVVSGAPRCADTLDKLQPSSKRLKVEHSSQPVISMTEHSSQPVIPMTEHSSQPVIPKTEHSQPVIPKTEHSSQPVIPKTEHSSQPVISKTESCKSSIASITEAELSQDGEGKDHKHSDVHVPLKSETLVVKTEIPDISFQAGFSIKETENEAVENVLKPRSVCEPGQHDLSRAFPKQENIKMEKEPEQLKKEDLVKDPDLASKSGKPKIKGVSLTELFTPEQVREHIRGLRQWVGQSKAKAQKNQAMENSMSENSCQLCAVEKLTFEPPPIYCTPCGARIKRNAMYYTAAGGETRHYFCIPCYNESRGDLILAEGSSVPKTRLEKKKNDEESEEGWVQCDKCEAWQHQICALFNGRRNDGGQAEYTCPNCYIIEVEQNERKPLLQSAVLGAKDLPRTILSDHIEERLFKRLKQERIERARDQGKSYDEVPTAESLVIRVVSSVDKKLEVKSRFFEIFREHNFPTEFPYKSKVVLLFQKIEGVEVCLFGMYVQEFGSESSCPNQRRVYLSYLDSVKYFRPEIKSANGEALRTFVYQEILIGYLEYCKLRGFTSCYIWACPPLKGEDYILYCHPEIQKTPKSDKLREWYLAMLRKAAKEGIVVETTNLYDHFFLQTGECRAKVTAARLPYFDGDYWPGAAEDIISQMSQEDDGRRGNKKGILKKPITKRALKASGQSDLSGNASKDLLLMHKLGETIHPMKEDFIMVHLQHCCTHCCSLMVAGNRWVCSQCKDFQLCDGCYEAEQKREDRERHPVNHNDKHKLYPVEITEIPADTKDRDEILESEFFDTRQAFLSLCQGNHYQYDTLRRAKHSSMMVLYHLHNPTAPAFVTTCNACHLDIESGQGWRCEVCPDYDVCNTCYSREGCVNHPHRLADQNAQNKEARQLRVLQLKKMLDLLVHASQCRDTNCQYPNCRKVKGLFQHALRCKVRAPGGCVLCKKMWYLLQLHARACKESPCHVPRCSDLKDYLRRLQQQADSRRRAAVMEMMRQRTAEVAGTLG